MNKVTAGWLQTAYEEGVLETQIIWAEPEMVQVAQRKALRKGPLDEAVFDNSMVCGHGPVNVIALKMGEDKWLIRATWAPNKPLTLHGKHEDIRDFVVLLAELGEIQDWVESDVAA